MKSAGPSHLMDTNGRFILPVPFEIANPASAEASGLHSAIIKLDTAGLVAGWASGAERLFGYSQAEALGQNIYHFLTLHGMADGDFERTLSAAYHDGKAEMTYCFNRINDTHFDGRCVVKPIWYRGDFQGFTVAIFPQQPLTNLRARSIALAQ